MNAKQGDITVVATATATTVAVAAATAARGTVAVGVVDHSSFAPAERPTAATTTGGSGSMLTITAIFGMQGIGIWWW